ncbi:hypothetical protein BRADI_4g36124v3 [Brachypodium distachyon]|uniref:Uncharacterized protein n=1 Tax=Brachypodium distachyon TaxID=15368 RepID=A0A2K2CSK8_BRADI|nr:hypothetical protein BRADI_4g36124v3 [Brachypodium distachyon]
MAHGYGFEPASVRLALHARAPSNFSSRNPLHTYGAYLERGDILLDPQLASNTTRGGSILAKILSMQLAPPGRKRYCYHHGLVELWSTSCN